MNPVIIHPEAMPYTSWDRPAAAYRPPCSRYSIEPLTSTPPPRIMSVKHVRQISRTSGGTLMRARFLGKDPESNVGDSPTLFATDRTDRSTFIVQGWKVTDPQVLADVGPVPDHEALIEIPEDVLKFYARKYQEEADH
jgi:hypothetical protein